MKIVFFSDIHGQLSNLETLLNKPDVKDALHLVNCGDFFQGYSLRNEMQLQIMASLLNDHPAHKLSVMGNNDSEDFMKLFNFVTAEVSDSQLLDNIQITVTHGHWGKAASFAPKNHAKWQIFAEGHTHVAQLYKDQHKLYLNPGSLSYPRSSLPPTYAILKEKTLSIRALSDDQVFFTEQLF